MTARVTRSNGETSRLKILDAALQIAGERGYSGTSISEVSKLSGMPNSSIYWHFKDKDALFAAVIEHSYRLWRADFESRSQARMESPGAAVQSLHESLANFPAFLRFGHLVILEQHEAELSARSAFLRIRKQAHADMKKVFQRETNCDPAIAVQLASLALALVDGAFLAGAAGEKNVLSGEFVGRMMDACVRDALTVEPARRQAPRRSSTD